VKAEPLTAGQKLRARHDVELPVIFSGEGPGNHESGGLFLVPAGTVLLCVGGAPGASAIHVYPEDYDGLKPLVMPLRGLESRAEYGFVIAVQDLEAHFELL